MAIAYVVKMISLYSFYKLTRWFYLNVLIQVVKFKIYQILNFIISFLSFLFQNVTNVYLEDFFSTLQNV